MRILTSSTAWLLLVSAALNLLLLLCQAQSPDRRPRVQRQWALDATQYGWLMDYQQAKQIARRDNKPLMVVFRCVP